MWTSDCKSGVITIYGIYWFIIRKNVLYLQTNVYIIKMTTAEIREKLDQEVESYFKRTQANTTIPRSHENITYADFLSDRMLIIEIIRRGVPYSLFNLIQHNAPFTERDWANILDISTKSLQRYKQTSRDFKSIQSEKIIEMAEVIDVGVEVFEDMERFKLWLDTPNFALGNLRPFDLLKDSYGKEMVMTELTRINHGILA